MLVREKPAAPCADSSAYAVYSHGARESYVAELDARNGRTSWSSSFSFARSPGTLPGGVRTGTTRPSGRLEYPRPRPAAPVARPLLSRRSLPGFSRLLARPAHAYQPAHAAVGALIWHDWARLLALTSGFYVGWAAIWALVYRKYFWDFVGATLGPGGLIPPPRAEIFVKIIVDVPVLPALNLLNALVTLALEWPLPLVKCLKLHSWTWLRITLYLWCALAASLVYQTAFVALFYLMTTLAYARSLAKGESLIPEPKRAAAGGRV